MRVGFTKSIAVQRMAGIGAERKPTPEPAGSGLRQFCHSPDSDLAAGTTRGHQDRSSMAFRMPKSLPREWPTGGGLRAARAPWRLTPQIRLSERLPVAAEARYDPCSPHRRL